MNLGRKINVLFVQKSLNTANFQHLRVNEIDRALRKKRRDISRGREPLTGNDRYPDTPRDLADRRVIV